MSATEPQNYVGAFVLVEAPEADVTVRRRAGGRIEMQIIPSPALRRHDGGVVTLGQSTVLAVVGAVKTLEALP